MDDISNNNPLRRNSFLVRTDSIYNVEKRGYGDLTGCRLQLWSYSRSWARSASSENMPEQSNCLSYLHIINTKKGENVQNIYDYQLTKNYRQELLTYYQHKKGENVGRGTTYYGCNESNTMLYVALLEIEVEDLDYRMSLMQKMGRLGSSLPRLGILSILPCLSGLRRALAGHP